MQACNPSTEVTFDSSFMEAAVDGWANQVPMCAGVLRPESDGLGEVIHERQFAVELKAGSMPCPRDPDLLPCGSPNSSADPQRSLVAPWKVHTLPSRSPDFTVAGPLTPSAGGRM